jgi:hypothetical protein
VTQLQGVTPGDEPDHWFAAHRVVEDAHVDNGGLHRAIPTRRADDRQVPLGGEDVLEVG